MNDNQAAAMEYLLYSGVFDLSWPAIALIALLLTHVTIVSVTICIGHWWGYRPWATPDASRNIAPLGFLIGGEELHNNHHAYPTAAKRSKMIPESERQKLAEALPKSRVLLTMVTMRRELAAVWGRSATTREQLVKQLQDWCPRAQASGIRPLVEFSRRLRQYA